MQYLMQPLLKNSYSFPGNDPAKVYSISAVNSGMALSPRAGAASVEQRTWKEDPVQQWRFAKQTDGTYKISCVGTGKVLDVEGGSTADVAPVILWDWHGGDNQRWRLVYLSAGVFRIENKRSGKCLDITGGQTVPGASLIQFRPHGGKNQQFRISELVNNQLGVGLGNKATVYQHGSFAGASQQLGPGSYDMKRLTIGNDQISSLKVPVGLRVTLYEHGGFQGKTKVFTSDASWVGDDFNDKTSAILVDLVATVYSAPNYQGASQTFGIGSYDIGKLNVVGNDRISSIRVPNGMQVELFADANYRGGSVVVTGDTPNLTFFNSVTSSMVVKMTGTTVPDDALCFGDAISLRSVDGRTLRLEADGRISSRVGQTGPETRFIVVRAGTTMNQTYVSYGDVIALRASNGKYIRMTANQTRADTTTLGDAQRHVMVRVGPADSRTFVNKDATISIRHASGKNTMNDGTTSGFSWFDRPATAERTFQFTIAELIDNTAEDGSLCGAQASAFEVCGTQACPTDACGAQGFAVTACGADACNTALCGAQAAVVNACGAAASAVVVCGVDVGGVIFCGAEANGISACGGNICGAAGCAAAACGADACGGAACGVAACVAAACGAAGCGGNACGADACPVDACGANACGGNACVVAAAPSACPIDACGANACAIDLCPFDMCGADACAVDIIPIIPGI